MSELADKDLKKNRCFEWPNLRKASPCHNSLHASIAGNFFEGSSEINHDSIVYNNGILPALFVMQ